MAGLPIVDNALGWAQIQLRGGWLRILTRGFWYGLALTSLIFLSCRLDPNASARILGMWSGGLLVLQGGALLLWAASGLAARVRLDVSTKMLESHRLSPIGGVQGVTGYLIGAVADMAPIVLINLVLGVIVNTFAMRSVETFLLTNVFILWLVMCVWPAAVFVGLASKISPVWILLVLLGAIFGGGVLMWIFPAIMLLISPILAGLVTGGARQWMAVYPITLIAQVILGTVFFIAGSRRFRSDERAAFGPLLGTIVVAMWVTLSVIGMRWQSLIVPGGYESDTSWHVQVTASMAVAIGLSIVPIMSVAWSDRLRRRRLSCGDPDVSKRIVPVELIVVVCAMLCLCVALVPLLRRAGPAPPGAPVPAVLTTLRTIPLEDMARLGAVVVLALLSISWIVRLCYRSRKPIAAWLVVWAVGVSLMVPLAVEMVRYLAGAKDFMPPEVLCLSPIGAMQLIIEQEPHSLTHGLLVQGITTAMIGLLFVAKRDSDTERQSG